MSYTRPLEESDIPEIVKGWNEVLVYDNIEERQFKYVVLEDPNYEKDCNLLAVRDDRIVGFMGAVAREGILGKDGRGRPQERHYGYIKAFYVLDNYWSTGIGDRLLNEELKCLKARGKRFLWVGIYTGRFFFPGIDIRYKRLLRFFDENGFAREFTINDLATDLKSFEPNEYQTEAKRRAEGIGVKVMDYEPEMIGMVREFVKELNMKHWFPDYWERDFNKSGVALVALNDEKVIGWSEYSSNRPASEFGGIAVLEAFRHKGIGTCLLMESMIRMKELGVSKVVARWAPEGFYSKSGWKIFRKYVVYRRGISYS